MSGLVLLPAVDVASGQAVRLVQGKAGTETSYTGGSYAVRTRATRSSRRSGATARSTSWRNAGSWAERVGLLKMKLNEGGRPGSSRPIRSSARPDSVVVGMSVVARRPPWKISHSDGTRLSRDRAMITSRKR